MNQDNLSLPDGIQVAKSAEQKAAELYADAAQQTPNPLAKRLFQKLAEFERHHYDKLVDLEESLRDKGVLIAYEGRELDLATSGEVKRIEGPDKKSAMAIITMASTSRSSPRSGTLPSPSRLATPRGDRCSSGWPRRSTVTT